MATPADQPRTAEDRAREFRQQQALLADLRASGDPALAAQAARLGALYHAREMALLADDVYAAGKGAGEAPSGWIRASANPEALRALGVPWSDTEVKEYLHPPKSGFRAEIYIPDSNNPDPAAKPVLSFKGTSGQVIGPDGRLRDTGMEDWVNNGRQGLGLQSDYYDRAMRLGVDVKRALGTNFQITAHSLGAGMGSAASAVTGAPAITWNAAGLHPITPQRYAEANGLRVFDTDRLVTAYQVEGEVLTDVQVGVGGMRDRGRMQLGAIANETAVLLRTPGLRDLVHAQIDERLPAVGSIRQDAHGLLDHLATTSGNAALKHMPAAAGQIHPLLAAKTRDAQGRLVDRPDERTIPEVAAFAGPLADMVSAGLASARLGRHAGEGVAFAGRGAGRGLDASGDVAEGAVAAYGHARAARTEVAGALAGGAVQLGGEATARVRSGAARVEAGIDLVQGEVQHAGLSALAGILRRIPGQDDRAERFEDAARAARAANLREAGQAVAHGDADARAIRGTANGHDTRIRAQAGALAAVERDAMQRAGSAIDDVYDGLGRRLREATASAPGVMASGAAVGGASAAGVALHQPGTPWGAINSFRTTTVLGSAASTATEAVQRHGITATVLPSLDHVIAGDERAAREHLRQTAPTLPAVSESPPITDRTTRTGVDPPLQIDQPGHPGHAMFRSAAQGVYAIDARHDRTPDLRSDQLAGSLAAASRQAGMTEIDHVVLSTNAARTFAIQGALDSPVHLRTHVDTMPAMNRALAESSAMFVRADAEQMQKAQQQALAEQLQPERVRGPVMS